MQYDRVIPRDFFNESKLLKCLGHLSLAILDNKLPEGVNILIDECGESFDIQLTEDGILVVANYGISLNNRYIMWGTTYNSKANFPLKCIYDYCEYEVFNQDGTFNEEFINFARSLK